MKAFVRIVILSLGIPFILFACTDIRRDHVGPTIDNISTSGKVIVISDCPSTSATITAEVTDVSKITSVLLWYRVGSDQSFAFTEMNLQNNIYTAAIEGADLQGHGYGEIEFYITAEDGSGNSSKSPIDKSIQFLPCVNN